jgi:hypothetical protein
MQTAKLFQVTPRTVHNWRSGSTTPPGAVLRLLRLMAGRELAVPGWEGWRMHSGKLWTPEGHRIEPTDGAWWSLMVRQARAFRSVYRQLSELRRLGYIGSWASGSDSLEASQPGPDGAPACGEAPAPAEHRRMPSPMVITGITPDNRHHLGAIMTPWHSTSDFRQPSKPTQRHAASASASASTPSSALPSTATCEASNLPQSPYSPLGMLEQSNSQASPRQARPQRLPRTSNGCNGSEKAASAPSSGPSPFSRLRLGWTLIPSQSFQPSQPPGIASGWPSGIGGTPPSPEAVAPEVQA